MSSTTDWAAVAQGLTENLHLASPPLAITFGPLPADVPAFDAPMPEPGADGRTGRVSAGCVFWNHAADRTFSTVAADHGNCSVGAMTHGFATLDEVAGNDDVAALLASGWVSMEAVPTIPVVAERPESVTYGPLADTPIDPDVVFLRLNAKQAMVLSDARPGIRMEGKPQCHIVAVAKQEQEAAISVGCMLSRVRTGMSSGDVTAAIPASQAAELVDSLRTTAEADAAVARYAAADALRFSKA